MRSPDFSASNAIVFPSATSRAVFGRRSTFPVIACEVIALTSIASTGIQSNRSPSTSACRPARDRRSMSEKTWIVLGRDSA